MSNTFLTPSMITLEALSVLKNNLTFTKLVNRRFDDKFGVEGAKIGDTVNVRKPPRYVGRTGAAISVEDIKQTSVPVQLSTQYGCDINFTSKDLLLSIERFSEDILGPAVATIANKIDYDGLQLYKSVPNVVGAAGTVPQSTTCALTYLQAGVALSNNAAPVDDKRSLVLTPTMEAYAIDGLKGLFNAQKELSEQYRKGRMGTALGFEWYMDQNTGTHVAGPQGGTPLVNGASQTGATLSTKGWTAAAAARLVKGDVFTVAGVYAVNPQSRQSTGSLQQFVVTADFSSAADGTGSVSIFPSIVTSGATQTVTASPADGAAITVFATASQATPQGLAFHRDAFTFACADLPLPKGVHMAARMSDADLGISMRLISAYDINTDQFPTRLDVLGGWTALRPELACRIAS